MVLDVSYEAAGTRRRWLLICQFQSSIRWHHAVLQLAFWAQECNWDTEACWQCWWHRHGSQAQFDPARRVWKFVSEDYWVLECSAIGFQHHLHWLWKPDDRSYLHAHFWNWYHRALLGAHKVALAIGNWKFCQGQLESPSNCGWKNNVVVRWDWWRQFPRERLSGKALQMIF